MKQFIFLTTLVLLASTSGFADIARPGQTPNRVPKPKTVSTIMTIRLDRDATEAKLLIPRSQIKELRAALDELDNDGDDTAAVAAAGDFSRTQTIVSGMFLSLAIVFGGMWFVRSGMAATKTGKTFVVLAVIAGVGSAATFVYANIGPPLEARSITGKLFDKKFFTPYRFASGKIKIETTEDGVVQLVVPDPPDKPTGEE